MTDPNLTARINEPMRQIDDAIKASGEKLDEAPDNPAIQRHSSGKSFVMSSSAMFKTDNWTVFHHDWKAQYGFAKELLEKRRFSVLRDMLDGKSFESRTFAPQVIESIKGIVGDLVLADAAKA